MKLQEIVVLLPCHSLEDFPLYYEANLADGLLAAWSAAWHPALLAAARASPTWARADYGPDALSGRLLLIPEVSEDRLPDDLLHRAQSDSLGVIRKLSNRNEIVTAALSAIGVEGQSVGESLVADFLALGYCWLQVELLTRQMRYSSQVDQARFGSEALAAADAALAGNEADSLAHLGQALDALNESRKYFYPVDAYLVDLTLVAETTCGQDLRRELDSNCPLNLLLQCNVLRHMAEAEPESLRAVKAALEAGRASIVGGELAEGCLPLMPPERVLADLTEAIGQYERLLASRPTVYGRRSYGLGPHLPQLLRQLGYRGALHFTLDEGHFPLGQQVKERWEGSDQNSIDALAKLPLDAARPETFLGLARKMGESMDSDHVATLMLVHWPGQVSPWYDDLRRIARLSPVLGKFVTLDEYFTQTAAPTRTARFAADDYRSPYLKQAAAQGRANPISSLAAEHQRQSERGASGAAATMLAALGVGESAAGTSGNGAQRPIDSVVAALPKAAPARSSVVVVNPNSFTQRVGVELPPGFGLPTVDGAVFAAGVCGERACAVVEVPSMGYVSLVPAANRATSPRRAKPIAAQNDLENEYLRLQINPATGAVQSVFANGQRGNLLAQQLALRIESPRPGPGEVWRDPDEHASYSTMVADSVEITCAGPPLGEIVSRGRLVDAAGRRLAGFTQTVRLSSHLRTFSFDIELEPDVEPGADPWNSYYAARFAWPDGEAKLWRGIGLERHTTDAKRIEAPDYVEIVAAAGPTTILTGGLPYHRRAGLRAIDCLLIVRGEQLRRFKLAAGVGLKHPAREAVGHLSAPQLLTSAAPAHASGWLFHLDARNVLATHWSPLPAEGAAGEPAPGFRVRLKETEGVPGRVTLRCCRPLVAARLLDFLGRPLVDVAAQDDTIALDVGPFEWLQVEARWRV